MGFGLLDAAPGYGLHTTLYNDFSRWSRIGVFAATFAALAAEQGEPWRLILDATHIKAHRTAAGLRKRRERRAASAAPKAG